MGRTENLIDPALTEKDAIAFYQFYEEFLRKERDEPVALLKTVSLIRRNDLREHVHNFATMRKRLSLLLREARHRDLVLSFPSTIRRLHDVVWEGEEAYGSEGATVMAILGSQASDYLDQTEMFRVDLDSLLADVPTMLPDDAEALRAGLAAGSGAFLYLLLAAADHVLITLLPHDYAEPTAALLRARTFLEQCFGEKAEDQIIEFFVLGGGYLRVSGERLIAFGSHPLFDPIFEDVGEKMIDQLVADFVSAKYRTAVEALRAAMPQLRVAVQG